MIATIFSNDGFPAFQVEPENNPNTPVPNPGAQGLGGVKVTPYVESANNQLVLSTQSFVLTRMEAQRLANMINNNIV